MECIRQLQDLFDANAENISNNDYIKICNSLKGVYEQFKQQEELREYTEEVDINLMEDRLNEITKKIIEESEKMWKYKMVKRISPRVRKWVRDNYEDDSIYEKSEKEYNKEAVEEYNKNIFRQRSVHINNILKLRRERKERYKIIGFYYVYSEDECV